jgi:hypothetical protein
VRARSRDMESALSVPKMKGSLTLGELEGSLHLLEIRCTKCDRYGRERLTRMIERYGKETQLPDVRHRLAGLSVPEGRCL